MADREEAFILETCGSFWIWKKVKENFGVISNVYTIQDDWDEISPALMNFAITKGFCSSSKDRFNFASKFCDFILTTGARCLFFSPFHSFFLLIPPFLPFSDLLSLP